MNIAQQLERARKELDKLEAQRRSELHKLAPSLGFNSTEDLIEALQATLQNGTKPKTGRKQRVVITKQTEKRVAAFAKRGWTGARIAKELNISVPSVQNIKKRLGLVKSRKK